MSDYYENLGKIQKFSPMPPDGQIIVPTSVTDDVPLLLKNLQHEDIAYAGPGTVMRDSDTDSLTIDSNDIAHPMPRSEWELRANPAVMRIFTLENRQGFNGYLLDMRRVALHARRGSGLDEGVDSVVFQSLQESQGTVFPLGAVLNDRGKVHYIGLPEMRGHAKRMMRRVDAFVAESWPQLFKHVYLLPGESDAIQRPIKPARSSFVIPFQSPHDTSTSPATESSPRKQVAHDQDAE